MLQGGEEFISTVISHWSLVNDMSKEIAMNYEESLKEIVLADERYVVMIAENRAVIRGLSAVLGDEDLLIAHSTSTYPCPVKELNLFMIRTLKEKYPGAIIGYSGHETGLATTYAAVVLGAAFVERHITLDRAMWGTDQAASVEIHGMAQLVSHIRDVEQSLGDGVKKLYESELASRKKLRRIIRPQLQVA